MGTTQYTHKEKEGSRATLPHAIVVCLGTTRALEAIHERMRGG